MNYPHSYLWINGRNVLLKDILDNRAAILSDFESSTFSFIREWMSGQKDFELTTSGSTGTPKQISISREQMTASARLTQHALQLTNAYNALVCLDTRYIAGKMMLVRSFETGMKIFVINPCANPLSKIPLDQAVHFAALVPYQVKAVLESKHPHLLDKLIVCIIGGAPLDYETAEKLNSFSPNFYLTYGMTETISHIALQAVNGKDKMMHFQTLPGITIEADQRGCLTIVAPYLKEKVVTNDLVEIIDSQHFRWLGRWDHVINSGGVKIVPENIEEKIGKIFTRSEINIPFFIQGISDEKLGQKVVLVMENRLPVETLQSFVQELIHSFPSYEIPKELYEASPFIYTETRKINRLESFKTAKLITSIKN